MLLLFWIVTILIKITFIVILMYITLLIIFQKIIPCNFVFNFLLLSLIAINFFEIYFIIIICMIPWNWLKLNYLPMLLGRFSYFYMDYLLFYEFFDTSDHLSRVSILFPVIWETCVFTLLYLDFHKIYQKPRWILELMNIRPNEKCGLNVV